MFIFETFTLMVRYVLWIDKYEDQDHGSSFICQGCIEFQDIHDCKDRSIFDECVHAISTLDMDLCIFPYSFFEIILL